MNDPNNNNTLMKIAATAYAVVEGVPKSIEAVSNAFSSMRSNNYEKVSTKREIITEFHKGTLTPTDTAIFLTETGAQNWQVNRVIRRSNRIHAPSGHRYSSKKVKWETGRKLWGLAPNPRGMQGAGWKENIGGGNWVLHSLEEHDSPPGTPLAGGPGDSGPEEFQVVVVGSPQVDAGNSEGDKELDMLGYIQDFASYLKGDTQSFDRNLEEDKELDTLGYTQSFDSYSTEKIDQKGENDLTTEFANSNSEQAPETPKLEKDLAEGGVDSYSNTRVLNAEIRNSPTIDVRDSPPAPRWGEKGRAELYQLEPIYMVRSPVSLGGSILGQVVTISSVVAVIAVIVRNFVFKPKEKSLAERAAERRQAAILAKEREKATLFFKKTQWGRMLPFVQTYYFRRDITTAFTVVAYQNQSLTRDQASYILRESCGLAEEAIQVLLPEVNP